MPLRQEEKIYRTFIVSLALSIALCLSAIFFGMSIRTKAILHEELLTQGRAHFKSILMTRLWNAKYGGVYVEKTNGVKSNPYLENPDIKTIDGRIFTLRNPAMMTREISGFSKVFDNFSFNITSLKPLNPDNRADAFETRSLIAMEQGKKEAYEIETINQQSFFRYIAPLYVTNECLKCHAKQGYKVGDIRGGISVTFNIDDFQKKLDLDTYLIIIFGVTTTTLLLTLVWFFTRRFIEKVAFARKEIERLAVTDHLTGIFNRRHLIDRFTEELQRARRNRNHLSFLIADIDRFKDLNDNYGHLKGDEVLKAIVRRIAKSIRGYDILGRFGGEEFIVILPETDIEDAMNLAERIRTGIKETSIDDMAVTVSIGVATLEIEDKNIDDLIRRADKALYAAKEAGRNCVKSSKI